MEMWAPPALWELKCIVIFLKIALKINIFIHKYQNHSLVIMLS